MILFKLFQAANPNFVSPFKKYFLLLDVHYEYWSFGGKSAADLCTADVMRHLYSI